MGEKKAIMSVTEERQYSSTGMPAQYKDTNIVCVLKAVLSECYLRPPRFSAREAIVKRGAKRAQANISSVSLPLLLFSTRHAKKEAKTQEGEKSLLLLLYFFVTTLLLLLYYISALVASFSFSLSLSPLKETPIAFFALSFPPPQKFAQPKCVGRFFFLLFFFLKK